MKKLLLVLVLLVVLAPCVSAGTPPSWAKRSVALEAGLGVVWAPNLMFFDHSLPGISGYLELDHYLSSLPMSVAWCFRQPISPASQTSLSLSMATVSVFPRSA